MTPICNICKHYLKKENGYPRGTEHLCQARFRTDYITGETFFQNCYDINAYGECNSFEMEETDVGIEDDTGNNDNPTTEEEAQ